MHAFLLNAQVKIVRLFSVAQLKASGKSGAQSYAKIVVFC